MPFTCTAPAVPTVQQDDATVRITRWDFAPGATTGFHSHGWPYFVVMLTDAVMKVEVGSEVTEVRLAAGQSYQRPPGIEPTHERFEPADGLRRDRDQAAGRLGAVEDVARTEGRESGGSFPNSLGRSGCYSSIR